MWIQVGRYWSNRLDSFCGCDGASCATVRPLYENGSNDTTNTNFLFLATDDDGHERYPADATM
jgi:hypothetical protein